MVPPVTCCKSFVVTTAEADGVLRSRLRLAENDSFTKLLLEEVSCMFVLKGEFACVAALVAELGLLGTT